MLFEGFIGGHDGQKTAIPMDLVVEYISLLGDILSGTSEFCLRFLAMFQDLDSMLLSFYIMPVNKSLSPRQVW